MFMAAGLIYAALGHDRIADLGRRRRARCPSRVLTFALAGLALMGVPSERRLSREEAAARRRRRVGAVVVGDWCWRAGGLHGELRRAASRTR